MTEDSTEHLGSSDCSSRKRTSAWLRIMAALSADDGKPHPTMMEAAEVMDRMRAALERIRWLASWHCDLAADDSDTSPDDQVAHVNGLIVRECVEALE